MDLESDIKDCSWEFFDWNNLWVPKFSLKSSHVEIQIFQTVSLGEMIKKQSCRSEIKNFLVDNLFIWNHLFKKIMSEYSGLPRLSGVGHDKKLATVNCCWQQRNNSFGSLMWYKSTYCWANKNYSFTVNWSSGISA
jgi:hypothetical protein